MNAVVSARGHMYFSYDSALEKRCDARMRRRCAPRDPRPSLPSGATVKCELRFQDLWFYGDGPGG
jgi:hypothetical protein